MPHWNDVRLMLRSCRPRLDERRASRSAGTPAAGSPGWPRRSRAAAADTSTAGSSSSLPSAARPCCRRSDTCRRRAAFRERRSRRRCSTSPRSRPCRCRRCAATRRHNSCDARWCRGSVVRMKSSFEMFRSRAHLPEACRDLVGERLRRHARLLRGALDLLAVLVGAGQEEHVVARAAAAIARSRRPPSSCTRGRCAARALM